jgi:predicted negative regulator of RcsB-dependent stress response
MSLLATGNRENARADYQKALTKKNPALSPNRKAHAQARVRELSSRS